MRQLALVIATEGGAGATSSPPAPARPRNRRLVVLCAAALVGWVVLGAVGGTFQERLAEVQENDAASFLPDDVESTTVNELSEDFAGSDTFPAFLVVESQDGPLTPEQLAAVQAFAESVPGLPVVVGEPDDAADRPADDPDDLTVGDFLAPAPPGAPAVPLQPSEDGEAVLGLVNLATDPLADALADGADPVQAAVTAIRDADDDPGDGLDSYVAGPAATVADFGEAFGGIDGILLGVALTAVLVILVVVYRSPLLPIIVILAAVFALSAASITVFYLADADLVQLNGQAQGILFILVVGATVDYALLLTARYREELRGHDDRFAAMRRAWRRSLEPIVASGATVILGLLCLLLSQLGSNRALGPVAATGIVFSMLSALTFLPAMLLLPLPVLVVVGAGAGAGAGAALLAVTGGPVTVGAAVGGLLGVAVAVAVAARLVHRRRDRSRHGDAVEAGRWVFWPGVPHVGTPGTETAGVWARVARAVGQRPRRTWVVVVLVLAGLAAVAPTFRGDGTAQSDTFLTEVESVTGQEALARHFPAGSDGPALVVVPEAVAEETLEVVTAREGVQSAALTAVPPGGEPVVVDGRVRIEAVLADASDSIAAEDTVRALRDDLDAVSEDALVGGQTAIQLDVLETSQADLVRIVPAVLLVILLVLALLLRSVVAPLLIVAANVLSFAATIGVAAVVFNEVLRFPGSDPAVVLFGFVFLVALGIDYSIFLMTRVREESARRGTRPGILVGLAVTGGVITSAGIVLATTFAALAVLPILFLAQIAFIVAFGVLLDTFVVRSLLLPALGYDIGRRIWWPHRLSREPQVPRGEAVADREAAGTAVRDAGAAVS
jgi:RND superfamily putative drug exporter